MSEHALSSTSRSSSAPAEAIDALDVSDAWKETFRLIERANPQAPFEYEKLDELDSSERRKVQYNFTALFFSALYYLWKGMYRKGLVILGGTWVYAAILTFAEGFFSITLPNVVYYIPPSVIAAMLANYDYYQKVVHGKQMWKGVGIFERLNQCVAFVVGAFLLLMYSVSVSAF